MRVFRFRGYLLYAALLRTLVDPHSEVCGVSSKIEKRNFLDLHGPVRAKCNTMIALIWSETDQVCTQRPNAS